MRRTDSSPTACFAGASPSQLYGARATLAAADALQRRLRAQLRRFAAGPAADGASPAAGRYTWKIDNFSEISKRELRSNVFEVGSYKWCAPTCAGGRRRRGQGGGRGSPQPYWSLSMPFGCAG
jgi:hypothetical protein